MSLDSAQAFVLKMRENRSFRIEVCKAAATQQISELLQDHDMRFDLNDLSRAMAACMEEMPPT